MTPLPWSISTLDMFVQCPHKFHRLKVLKDVKDKPFDQGDFGIRFHAIAEGYLKAKGGLVPSEFALFKEYFDYLLRATGEMFVEGDMALTKNLTPCGFFSKDVWVRGKNDLLVLRDDKAFLIDHKTNAKRKDYTRQGILLSLFVFYTYPHVMQSKVCFFFTSERVQFDTNDAWMREQMKHVAVYTREQIPDMWKAFLVDLKAYAQAFRDDYWPKCSSGLCRGYCPVADCEHYAALPLKKKNAP